MMRDALPFLGMWFGPAFALAALITLIAYLRRALVWWHPLALLTLAIIGVAIASFLNAEKSSAHLAETFVVLVPVVIAWSALMVAGSVAWVIVKSISREAR
jgi:hypothetical protein